MIYVSSFVRVVKVSSLLLTFWFAEGFANIDYMVELHDRGNEEIAGEASYYNRTGVTGDYNRTGVTGDNEILQVSDKTLKTETLSVTRHSIKTKLFKDRLHYRASHHQRAGPEFFNKSLIDKIWMLKEEPDKGAFNWEEEYIQKEISYSNRVIREQSTARIGQRRSFVYENVKEYCSFFESKIRFLPEVNWRGTISESAFYWDINKPEAHLGGAIQFEAGVKFAFPTQTSPLTSVEYLATPGEQSFFPQPLTLLYPFSHDDFQHNLMDTNDAPIISQENNIIFPMNWSYPVPFAHTPISVTVRIRGTSLRLYKRTDNGVRKSRIPTALNRYEFITPPDKSMDLIIWANPQEVIPSAWEYKAKLPDQRAIRYVRILNNDKKIRMHEAAIDNRPTLVSRPVDKSDYQKTVFAPMPCEGGNPTQSERVDTNHRCTILMLLLFFSSGRTGSHFGLTPSTSISN